jgi:hypothetical protein
MSFRLRKKSVVSGDSLTSPIREYTSSSIVDIIRERIPRQGMESFLSSRVTSDSVRSFSGLLQLRDGAMYGGSGADRKRLFDLALAVVYEELLSLDQVAEVCSPSPVGLGPAAAADLFEKMLVLEYNLFYLTKDLGEFQSRSFERFYMSENLVSVYYSDKSRRSYSDLANLNEELDDISSYVSGQSSGSESDVMAVIDDFTASSIVGINGKDPAAEGGNISKYRFLFNYNTTSSLFDRELLRKYWAVTPDNLGKPHGYYIKDGERVYLDGVLGYSYYGLLKPSYDEAHGRAHDYIIKLWENISQRTINYSKTEER